MSKSISLIDNHIVYRFSSFIIYFYFVFTHLTSVSSDANPILPNLISLILLSASMFLLTLISQIIEPVKQNNKWLIQRLLLSAIPPLLGLILSIRFFKEEKIKQRDQLFLIMSIVMIIIMSFLSLAYGLLLLLLYVGSTISGLSVYFLSVGIWALIGITLADSGFFYTSEIKFTVENDLSKQENFTQRSSIFISKVLSTSKNRFIFLVISYLLSALAILLIGLMGNNPISI
ncbi:MAG: hypothetical protein GPJ54_09615 [Candidatus Heimdallarchaeota archaeon]|nr:hypothetical protein [Candidatus Heimdallarchaeota archaeon]